MDIYAGGTHAIFGKTGHFLVILSFVSALLATYGFARATAARDDRRWLMLGRLSFLMHAMAILGAIVLLLAMIRLHMFEYSYVWRSSNKALPMRFLLSSFWEGQEGSTMLWMFWHVVIGILLIFRARRWEAPVMITISLAQALLGSMVLGVYILGYKMGASPFALLRDTMEAPIFRLNPEFIPEDGSGLNPLLQNYWMTIHPPTLFLGYALTIVPFAYAAASLIWRSYRDWVRPAMPWLLAVVLVLGAGILMGGAWAYEALSFGGFWAWDPVENASLVPWLLAVAGLHTLLVYRSTGHSLTATYGLLFASFIMVLYSSFLTKSGILGDASVHSFTDMGMSGQLVCMMIAFSLPAIVLVMLRRQEFPGNKKEEALSSREFWMFIGGVIFVLSALHITVMTSFPVINKVFGTRLAPPSDVVAMFNSVQVWVAILLGILLASGQFLSYRRTVRRKFLRSMLIPLVLTLATGIPVMLSYELYGPSEILLLFAGLLGVFANLFFLVFRMRKKYRLYGASLAHIGFALMLVGILISQGRQYVVSHNRAGVYYGDSFSEKDIAENILLYKGEPALMQDYELTYLGDSVTDHSVYYKVQYRPEDEGQQPFVLMPYLQTDPQMGNVANPSTKRRLGYDLYTHITAAPVNEDGRIPDSTRTEQFVVRKGDTLQLTRSAAIVTDIGVLEEVEGITLGADDIAVGAHLSYVTLDSTYDVLAVYLIQGNIARSIPREVPGRKVTFILTQILPEEGGVELTVVQEFPRYIIMKAIVFPWINLLWSGAVIMVLGVGMSIASRVGRRRGRVRR